MSPSTVNRALGAVLAIGAVVVAGFMLFGCGAAHAAETPPGARCEAHGSSWIASMRVEPGLDLAAVRAVACEPGGHRRCWQVPAMRWEPTETTTVLVAECPVPDAVVTFHGAR